MKNPLFLAKHRRVYLIKLACVIGAFMFTMNTFAQRGNGRSQGDRGGIGGIVVDENTGETIPFANVIAYVANDSIMVKGTNTDEEGRFRLGGLPFGKYDVLINFLGYDDYKLEDIEINKEMPRNRLGEISLKTAATSLDEVEVTAIREEMEFMQDRRVYNVSKNPANVGGSAEDVLRNLPSVTVDIDGGVSLRGSTNIRVLVDGKPSALTGGDRQAIFDQIPANSIKSIEIMTNPSAKYSPEGTAGIINIILKKQRRQGFNMKITANVGNNEKYDGGLALNYRWSKYNVFVNYNGQHKKRWRRSDVSTFFTDSLYYLDQNSDGFSIRKSHNFTTGFEYRINKNSNLTTSVQYSLRARDNESENYNNYLDENRVVGENSIRTAIGEEPEYVWDYNINYQYKFKKEKQVLDASASWSKNVEEEQSTYLESFYDAQNQLIETPLTDLEREDNIDDRGFLKIDYTHPFNKFAQIEAGTEIRYRNSDQDYRFNDCSEADDFCNQFIFEEQIYAAYLNYGGGNEIFSYQIGVRGEQVLTNSDLITTDENFDRDYLKAYPSAFLTYAFNKQSKMQASYSRRVNRPRFRALIPFPSRSNSQSRRIGNPNLKPEFIDSYEVSYLHFFEKGTFNASTFYKKTNDLIQRFLEFTDDDIREVTYTNLNSSTSYGLELIGTYRPFKWWRMSANASFFETRLNGENIEADLTNAGRSWNGRLSSNWTVWKNMDLQLTAFYRSTGVSVQGTYEPFYFFDFGAKKSILKGKGTISIRLSDIFNTRKFSIERSQDDFITNATFQRESRIVYLEFTYALRAEKSKRRGRAKRGSQSGGGSGDAEF